ncbi:TIGR04013 family B12-binding domain/radical SAM domain-containing protein [bacterium]|nr:TIGR04013 family B12-binding domain/radical SAM domain-containing protein [bacterium]
MKNRIPFILRLADYNRFSLPVLLHALESQGLDRHFDLQVESSATGMKKRLAVPGRKIIGYGFMTPHIPEVWKELSSLKSSGGNDTLWIAGGSHVTGDPDSGFAMGFDAVFQGECERILPEFCLNGLDSGFQLKQRVFAGRTEIPLDSSFPVSKAMSFIPPVEIMRGCLHTCRFCQTGSSKKPRYRSMESVESYFKELPIRRLQFRACFICPSGLEYGSRKAGEYNPDLLESLLRVPVSYKIRHIEYGIFPSELRPETITPESLRILKKYCTNKKITIGAQTGSERMLALIGRGHSLEQAEQAAAWVHEHGFRPMIDIIIGFPGETPEDRLCTLEWARKVHLRSNARCQMHYFIPLSGTALAGRRPSPIDAASADLLDREHQAGIVTDWWKKGLAAWEDLEKDLERLGSMSS